MTLGEFNDLNELEQIKAIWQKGAFLAERTDGLSRCVLYQLDAFYIEFSYGIADNVQKEMTAFAGTGALDPWLEDICLPAIF